MPVMEYIKKDNTYETILNYKCIHPELFRFSSTRLLKTWDRSSSKWFRTRGKIDIELWCIPDGFLGLTFQEMIKQTELYLTISYLVVM